MAGVTGSGGVVFRPCDPQALPGWRAAHPGLTPGPGGLPWQQEAGLAVCAPFPRDPDHVPADRAVMLNLRVDDLGALIARLDAAGIAVETRAGRDGPHGPHGRFARVHVPEGNPVELRQPPG